MSDWRDNPRPVPGVTRARPVEAPTATAPGESRCTCDAVNAAFANGRERALRELRESVEWKAMKRVAADAWADGWDMSAWDDLCELVEGEEQ